MEARFDATGTPGDEDAQYVLPAFADRTVESLTAEEVKAWRDKLARGHERVSGTGKAGASSQNPRPAN